MGVSFLAALSFHGLMYYLYGVQYHSHSVLRRMHEGCGGVSFRIG